MLWITLFSTLQPPDFFSNPVWQFLSGIGAIIAIPIAVIATIVAITTYRYQQNKKQISYRIVSDAPIVSINKKVESRVKVLLDNHEARETRLLVLRIWNAGKHSLVASDYFEPITFEFTSATVIDSDILNTEPPKLINPELSKTFLKFTNNSIQLPAFPLNPNDSITFTALLSNKSSIIKRGRIKEGKIIENNENELETPYLLFFSLIFASALFIDILVFRVYDFVHYFAISIYYLGTVFSIIWALIRYQRSSKNQIN